MGITRAVQLRILPELTAPWQWPGSRLGLDYVLGKIFNQNILKLQIDIICSLSPCFRSFLTFIFFSYLSFSHYFPVFLLFCFNPSFIVFPFSSSFFPSFLSFSLFFQCFNFSLFSPFYIPSKFFFLLVCFSIFNFCSFHFIFIFSLSVKLSAFFHFLIILHPLFSLVSSFFPPLFSIFPFLFLTFFSF